jgi:apolipoprotein D and lipocalin family protein
VVEHVDLNRYTGTWYEIARLPNSFEKGLQNISATYSIRDDGKINVLNKGQKISGGEWNVASGIARIPDKSVPAKLKVSFFWPFSGKYWILYLDENYQYVLVGEPSRKYMWILSRNPHMDKDAFDKLLQIEKEKGFAT